MPTILNDSSVNLVQSADENRLFSDKDNFDTSTEQEDKTQSNIDNHDSSNHINTATQHENNEEIQNTEDEINNSALENNLHEQQNEPSEEDLSSTAQDDTAIQHNTDDGDVTEDNEDIEKPPPLTPEELREQKDDSVETSKDNPIHCYNSADPYHHTFSVVYVYAN